MNLLTNTLHRRWSCLLLIIAFMSGFQMFAQSVGASNQLTGRVLDEYDQPIIGAVLKFRVPLSVVRPMPTVLLL